MSLRSFEHALARLQNVLSFSAKRSMFRLPARSGSLGFRHQPAYEQGGGSARGDAADFGSGSRVARSNSPVL